VGFVWKKFGTERWWADNLSATHRMYAKVITVDVNGAIPDVTGSRRQKHFQWLCAGIAFGAGKWWMLVGINTRFDWPNHRNAG